MLRNDRSGIKPLINVLVVGQTPPPYGGQSVMIQNMLTGKYTKIKLYHIRMAFSEEMDEIGKFRLKKVVHLFDLIGRILVSRSRYRTQLLYYPPAGPNKVPMFRDLAILILTRWLFDRIVFHFHAGGVSGLYPRMNRIMKFLFEKAYFFPDTAIQVSALAPSDGHALNAARVAIIPNGIRDRYPEWQRLAETKRGSGSILYMGILSRSKGILDLVEAAGQLKRNGMAFSLVMAGRFKSADFEREVMHRINTVGINEVVSFPGVLTGDRKWRSFAEADIFCYPSYFESETFGLAVLEAMQFSLPVVATTWRGIPTIVRDAETGYLVPVRDPIAIQNGISQLIANSETAERMGRFGRKCYLQSYTLAHFRKNMENVLVETATKGQDHPGDRYCTGILAKD